MQISPPSPHDQEEGQSEHADAHRYKDLARLTPTALPAPPATVIAGYIATKEAKRSTRADEEIKHLALEREGRAQYFYLRKKWSWMLAGVLIVTILAQNTLLYMVGIKKLVFTDQRYLVEIVCSGNFIQIIGLVYIVVRFLFPSAQPSPQPAVSNPSPEPKTAGEE